MSLFTNEDGLFQKIFGFLGKMIMLNLLWMVCSLPLITIGASTTALYYCTLKLHKYQDFSIKDFFKSFRVNFKQATFVWVIIAAILITLPMPVLYIPVVIIALYIFPILAAFENKTRMLLTHTVYFAFKHVGFTIAIAAITILPMFFTIVDAALFPVYLFVWLLCGFAVTAYITSWFYYKMFQPYLGEIPKETVEI